MRKLRLRPPRSAVLMQDETLLRLLPNLRRSWTLQGQQARVGISGHNAQRVLSCALDLETGQRTLLVFSTLNSAGFQELLAEVRKAYGHRPVYMLLDGASLHKAKAAKAKATQLNVTLIELPRQCPELNCMDQLWRSVKADVSSNRQYKSIDEHAKAAQKYISNLTNEDALRKAGVLAKNFWLKAALSKYFCTLT